LTLLHVPRVKGRAFGSLPHGYRSYRLLLLLHPPTVLLLAAHMHLYCSSCKAEAHISSNAYHQGACDARGVDNKSVAVYCSALLVLMQPCHLLLMQQASTMRKSQTRPKWLSHMMKPKPLLKNADM
jgi:hypothetical protein